MFAREHRACRKESRRCQCNEFGHTAKLNAPAALVVQNLRATIGGRFRSLGAKRVKAKSEVAIPPKREGAPTLTWHCKIPPSRNGSEMEESRSWNMKKLRLLSLVGVTSIILAQAEWSAAQSGGPGAGGPGGSGSGGISGGNLGGYQSSTENQVRSTQVDPALPAKHTRNVGVAKPSTVSKPTVKPAPAGGKKKGEKVSSTPRPR